MATDERPLSDVRLRADRVRLRPLVRADARAAFELVHGRESILRWLIWPGPKDVAELESAYAHWVIPQVVRPIYRLAIEEAASSLFAGTISLRFPDQARVANLGYWIGEEFQGRGLGSEAIALTCYLAFEHLGCVLLTAEVFVGNDASARVLEKSGFRRERTLRQTTFDTPAGPGSGSREQWVYTLTPSDFARRAEPQPLVEEQVERAVRNQV